jgi:hypothetical protein
LADGRLLPAQEQWARDLGESDLAALRTYLDAANNGLNGAKPTEKVTAKTYSGQYAAFSPPLELARQAETQFSAIQDKIETAFTAYHTGEKTSLYLALHSISRMACEGRAIALELHSQEPGGRVMAKIKTNLLTAATDENGNVELLGPQAFSSVLKLGLLAGTQDRETKAFATDAKGLQKMKEGFGYLQQNCVFGLQGIGALISAANPQELTRDDLANIGMLLKDLSKLAMEASDWIESIEIDERRREEAAEERRASGAPPHNISVPQVTVWLAEVFGLNVTDALAEAEKLVAMKRARDANGGEV